MIQSQTNTQIISETNKKMEVVLKGLSTQYRYGSFEFSSQTKPEEILKQLEKSVLEDVHNALSPLVDIKQWRPKILACENDPSVYLLQEDFGPASNKKPDVCYFLKFLPEHLELKQKMTPAEFFHKVASPFDKLLYPENCKRSLFLDDEKVPKVMAVPFHKEEVNRLIFLSLYAVSPESPIDAAECLEFKEEKKESIFKCSSFYDHNSSACDLVEYVKKRRVITKTGHAVTEEIKEPKVHPSRRSRIGSHSPPRSSSPRRPRSPRQRSSSPRGSRTGQPRSPSPRRPRSPSPRRQRSRDRRSRDRRSRSRSRNRRSRSRSRSRGYSASRTPSPRFVFFSLFFNPLVSKFHHRTVDQRFSL